MLNDKKGMEIAVSTVVGLILGALMLFAGIALFTSILVKTDDTYSRINDQMRDEIIKAFDTNDPIYIHRNPVSPRKSEDVIFGVGVQNIFNTTRLFNISIIESTSTFSSDEYNIAYLPNEPFNITPKSKEVVFIIVPTKNLPSGQHSLILNVTYKNGAGSFVTYDSPKILYVNK